MLWLFYMAVNKENHWLASILVLDWLALYLLGALNNYKSGPVIVYISQGRRRRLVKFLYNNHPTKIDVTPGQFGVQQPVSAKSNYGVWATHDFSGFLSHQHQELWTVDVKDVVKIFLRRFEQGFLK